MQAGKPLNGPCAKNRVCRMPRRRQRVCLEAGFKLDLNNLMRQGCVVPGAYLGFRMRWRNSYTGEETASATITANMMSKHEGYLRIQMKGSEQMIILTPRPRRFGGHQWYFVCPLRAAVALCCGDQWVRRNFGAVRHRGGDLPMPHHFWIPTIALIAAKRKSSRD